MQKKNILKILFIFVLVFSFRFSFAEIVYDVPSPADLNTVVNVTCDTGDVFALYDGTATLISLYPCSGQDITSATPEMFTLVECDTTLSPTLCDGLSLEDILLDDGFISKSEYIFIDLASLPCLTTNQVCYRDWLFMNLVFLFLIAYFIFSGFISPLFAKSKDIKWFSYLPLQFFFLSLLL